MSIQSVILPLVLVASAVGATPASDAPQAVTLTFKLECPQLAELHPARSLEIGVGLASLSGNETITTKRAILSDARDATVAISVRPDAYDVVAKVEGDIPGACVTANGAHVLVMPNNLQSATFRLMNAIPDGMPYEDVAGTIGTGIEVRAFASYRPISCGDKIDVSGLLPLKANVRDGAYGLEMMAGQSPPMPVLLQATSGNRRALIALPVAAAKDVAQITYLRFDVANDVLAKYASPGGDVVGCPARPGTFGTAPP